MAMLQKELEGKMVELWENQLSNNTILQVLLLSSIPIITENYKAPLCGPCWGVKTHMRSRVTQRPDVLLFKQPAIISHIIC